MKKAMTWRKIFRYFRLKNKEPKKSFDNKEQINNVYGNETVAKQVRRFHNVHYILKYKLMFPILFFIRKWVDKKIYQKPREDQPQFEYVKLWESVFEEATAKWGEIYLNQVTENKNKEIRDKEYWRKRFNEDQTGSLYMLNTLMRIGTVGTMNDDAYMEWLPFFFYEAYSQMGAKLKDKQFNGRAQHLLHTVPGMMDSQYEMIYLHLKTIKNFEVRPLGTQEPRTN